MFASLVRFVIRVALKCAPWSVTSHSMQSIHAIHLCIAFVALSLWALEHGNSYECQLMSLLSSSSYFGSQSFATLMHRKSACTTLLGFVPWSATDDGLGTCSLVLNTIQCIHDETSSRTSLFKSFHQYNSAIISKAASKVLWPRSPRWASTKIRSFSSFVSFGIHVCSSFLYSLSTLLSISNKISCLAYSLQITTVVSVL